MKQEDIENKIGFTSIRNLLLDNCITEGARRKVHNLSFSKESSRIAQWVSQVTELSYLLKAGEISYIREVYEDENYLNKLAVQGSILSEEDFQGLRINIAVFEQFKTSLLRNKEHSASLLDVFEFIPIEKNWIDSIDRVIDFDGTVKSSASNELGMLRRSIEKKENQTRSILNTLFRKYSENGWVPSGSSISVKNGAWVIPIVSEQKRKVQGVVQDESGTGQTIFIEPLEVIQAGNELTELKYRERREIVKILSQLTDLFRDEKENLEKIDRGLKIIDFIQAKAKLSITLNAIQVNLSQDPIIDWIEGIHPLLFLSLSAHEGRKVVPLTIDITSENRILVVSGPNAGGKSVCLKTVALLQYMYQCGIPVPMKENSTMGIFDRIFIDIGDEQSIENDLSTYSSHLKNMKYVLEKATDRSLVLIDEFGSGTDPAFGGAMAEVLLKLLNERGIYGVITTHYNNLKSYAEKNKGIRNASMRYDVLNLKPLFELEIGKPGSSFAFEIAKNIGLKSSIIEDARQIVGEKVADLDKILQKVEAQQEDIKKREVEIRKKEKEIQQLKSRYETLYNEIEGKKKEIITKAKSEALDIIGSANKEIEKTIRHIKENKANKQETKRIRERLKGTKENMVVEDIKVVKGQNAESEKLKVGNRVRIRGGETNGVITQIKGGKATIESGNISMRVEVKNLEKISEREGRAIERKTSGRVNTNIELISGFNGLLDVRGRRVDEVYPMVDKFLDQALLSGYNEIKILHGKGDGILRKVIREYIKDFKNVESITDEDIKFGGAGITVVILK